MDSQTYIQALLKQLPEFEPLYREHLKDNFGEVLGHPLFGDLRRFTENALAQGDIVLVGRVVAFLNEAAQSEDDELTELVHVSFLEYIPNSPLEPILLPLLNEPAKTMYQTIVNWRPIETAQYPSSQI